MGLPLSLALAGLATGVLMASGVIAPALALMAGLSVMVPIAWTPGRRVYWREVQQGVATILLVLALTGSAGWISMRLGLYKPIPGDASDLVVQARIVSYRVVNERVGHLVVQLLRERRDDGWRVTHGRILLLARPGGQEFRPGDRWVFGPLLPEKIPETAPNSTFRPARYWFSRGVTHQAWLNEGKARLDKPRRHAPFSCWFKEWQNRFSDRIASMPVSKNCSGLLSAMILGDRSDLDPQLRDEFARAGIVHVLSVSGLHVGIIYLMLKRLYSLIGFRRRRLPLSAVTLLLIWAYVCLTGSGPSAVRAGGMITLFEVAWLMRRSNSGLQVLGAAGFIHLALNPFALFSAGAQLSYLAVAGIFTWSPLFKKLNDIRFPFNKLTGPITVSISAQSLIIPPLIFWFGWFPVYFLAGNLLLVPLMITAFYLGITLFLLDLSGWQPDFLYWVADRLVDVAVHGATLLGSLPGNIVEPGGLSWIDVPLYYLVLLAARGYLKRPDNRKLLFLLALILASVARRAFLSG